MDSFEIKDEELIIESFYPIDKIPVLRFTHKPSGFSVEYKNMNARPLELKIKAKKEIRRLLEQSKKGLKPDDSS